MEITIQILVYGLLVSMFLFRSWMSSLNYKNRFAPIPEEVAGVYDEAEYKKWLAYYMENFRFQNVTRIIDFLVFLALLVFGGFVFINDLASGLSNNVAQVMAFMGIYYLITFIIGLAPSYYDTFVIEEKYGFNKTTKKTWILDKIKGILLTVLLGGGLVYLILALYTYAGNMFFIYTWLSLVVIIIVTNIIYVPVIVPIFNKLSPLEEGELKDKLSALAEKTGYELDKISVMDASKRSTRLNAYFTGFGKVKRIVLFDTLIEKCTPDEVVAVLAHEIGHNKRKHIPWNLLMTFINLSIMVAVLLLVFNEEFSTAFGFESMNFAFSLLMFSVVLSPVNVLVGMIQSMVSRKFEYQADAYAAEHTTKDDMINALLVLTKENFAHLTPHPLFVKMRYSHPPTSDRIKAIKKL